MPATLSQRRRSLPKPPTLTNAAAAAAALLAAAADAAASSFSAAAVAAAVEVAASVVGGVVGGGCCGAHGEYQVAAARAADKAESELRREHLFDDSPHAPRVARLADRSSDVINLQNHMLTYKPRAR